MDYENDLLNDLQSDEDIDIQDENDFLSTLAKAVEDYTPLILDNLLQENEPSESSIVLPLIPHIVTQIEEYQSALSSDYHDLVSFINASEESAEYKFIQGINEFSSVVSGEISGYYSLLKLLYKPIFPELESLVMNPLDYARVVLIIKDQLQEVKSHQDDLSRITSNEKVLVILMAASLLPKPEVSEDLLLRLVSTCRVVLELDDILLQISKFISGKLAKFAPNVSAIVGPITTSLLLIATGSLRALALTPSCNLPSLGVKELSGEKKTSQIRQRGYIYNSEILQYLPPDIIKQVMRIVSGKVILAARIDLAKSSLDGAVGRQYAIGITAKIEKLLTPPKHTDERALPAPIDAPSKKRGGRRARKYKERFQMSDLRKAQNKMAFGTQEELVTDAFGDELGLGMSKASGIAQIKVNSNTQAKMSKGMAQRLHQKEVQPNTFRDDFDIILGGEFSKPDVDTSTSSKWFSGMKRESTAHNEPSKKQKI